MANTNPQVITFCNAHARPMADSMASNYWTAKKIITEWNSLNLAALILNDGTLIEDGSATDGRSPITGQMVTSIIVRATEIVTDYEAAGNAKLNTISQVAVNTASRF